MLEKKTYPNPMTLEDLIASEKLYFTPGDVCAVLQTNPQTIRVTARQRPDLIGYEFTFSGNRMKIPKIPFLRFLGVDI